MGGRCRVDGHLGQPDHPLLDDGHEQGSRVVVRTQLRDVVAAYGGAVGDPVDRRVQGRVHPAVLQAQLDQFVEVAVPGGPDGDGRFLSVCPHGLILPCRVKDTEPVRAVVAVLRYPLKSAQGEQLVAVHLDRDGLQSDRTWACIDVDDGTVGSAKHPGRWGRLLQVEATVDPNGGSEVIVGVHGRRAIAGSRQADELLSEHLQRPVRLTQDVPDQARMHRQLPDDPGLVPQWMNDAAAGQEMVTEVSGARPGGRFVDFGAVHLVTTGALARLARQVGRSIVDAACFRPNLCLDAPRDPAPGQELRIGDVVLRVVLPTPRCIVPALHPDPATPLDRHLLTTLARDHQTAVGDVGRAACFGVYAEVLQPGRIGVGQAVR